MNKLTSQYQNLIVNGISFEYLRLSESIQIIYLIHFNAVLKKSFMT